MSAPTARQLEVLRALHRLWGKSGIWPTIRELGAALGIRSTNGVREHLEALKRHGLVESGPPNKARMLTLSEAGFRLVEGG